MEVGDEGIFSVDGGEWANYYHIARNGFAAPRGRIFEPFDKRTRFGCSTACGFFKWFYSFLPDIEDGVIKMYTVPVNYVYLLEVEDLVHQGHEDQTEQCVFDITKAKLINQIEL